MTLEVDFSTIGSLFVGAIFAIIIVTVAVFFIRQTLRSMSRRGSYQGQDRPFIQRRWQEVEKLLERGDESSLRIAVVEADKLLDYTLKSLVMPGQTLGERLKVATARYPDVKEVWWAHKLRNELVHDAHQELNIAKLRSAVETFGKALKRLGAL